MCVVGTETCSPGNFSGDGFVPCAECPVNTYTDVDMATDCTACPDDTFTLSTGSSSAEDCEPIGRPQVT